MQKRACFGFCPVSPLCPSPRLCTSTLRLNMSLFIMLAFYHKDSSIIWAWSSTGPRTRLSLLDMHPVLFLPLPIGYVDLCVNTLWQTDRTSLWLAKTYVIPAGMYGSQVWGTVFFRQAGSSLDCCLRFI